MLETEYFNVNRDILIGFDKRTRPVNRFGMQTNLKLETDTRFKRI